MDVPDAVRRDLYEALAGAVLSRDELAERHAGGIEMLAALETVAALNRVLEALDLPPPNGTARMVPRIGRPPEPGWVDEESASEVGSDERSETRGSEGESTP